MKKFFKIVGIVIAGLFVLGIIGAIFGGNDDGPGTSSTPAQTKETAPAKETTATEQPAAEKEETPAPAVEEPKSNVFKFGTEVPYESGLNIKVTGVTETSERNQFEDPVKHVMVVGLEVTNTTGAEVTVSAYDMNVQDASGFQGETYPGGDQIVTIAPGGKARMQFQYGVDGEGPYKVIAGEATWEQ